MKETAFPHVHPVRAAALLLALVLCMSFAPHALTTAEYDENNPDDLRPNNLRAESAIVIEADSGEALFEKNADDLRYPASLTKIMTVMIALVRGNQEDIVTVSQSAVSVPEDSSLIGLMAGEQLPLGELIRATMVKSGNDGAVAIAEHIAGSEPAFAGIMNEVARYLGCTQTNFVNAHGYHHEYHYTTARDMAIIAREAMRYEAFREVAALWKYTLPRTNLSGPRALESRDRAFLDSGQETYYPYANGIKSGEHSQAGLCYAGSAQKDGVDLITIVLKSNAAGRWRDTKRLMEYGFSQFVSTSIEEIFRKNPKVVDISSFALDDANLGRLELSLRKVDPDQDDHLFGLADQEETWKQVYNTRTSIDYNRVLDAPVEAGEVVGTMTYMPEGSETGPVIYELIATRSIARRVSVAPSIEEIHTYTANDLNPFPRFSLEFMFIMLLPVLLVAAAAYAVFRLVTRKKKTRFVRRTPYQTRYYR